GHESVALFVIEAAGDLDLFHVLASRDVEPEPGLDELFFLGGGFRKVHPDHVVESLRGVLDRVELSLSPGKSSYHVCPLQRHRISRLTIRTSTGSRSARCG